jgi:hypothetical protein
MQENPSPHRCKRRDPPSTEGEDALVQRAVLALVIAEHPTQLTFPELARELCTDPEDFAEADALARAVRDLAFGGLVRCDDLVLQPTRAALHFDRLDLD